MRSKKQACVRVAAYASEADSVAEIKTFHLRSIPPTKYALVGDEQRAVDHELFAPVQLFARARSTRSSKTDYRPEQNCETPETAASCSSSRSRETASATTAVHELVASSVAAVCTSTV